MRYYYLDGIDKLGPYSLEEIKSRNLSLDTMVFREDKSHWSLYSEFDEFHSTNESKKDINENNIKNHPVSDKNGNKIVIPPYAGLIILSLFFIGLSALITHFQRKEDYNRISDEINKTFKGKSIISDFYIRTRIDGALKNVVYSESSIFPSVSVNGILIFTKPYDYNSISDESKKWDIFKSMKQYYEAGDIYSSTGFDVYRAEKYGKGFTIRHSFSGDMAYLVSDSTYHPESSYSDHVYDPYANNYGGAFVKKIKRIPGYYTSNNRPSIETCYESAAKFLTEGNDENSYLENSYGDILSLKYIKSDFYEIKQSYPKYFQYLDTIKVDYNRGKIGYMINDNKITRLTSRQDPYVYNSQWVVWHKSYYNRYSIEQRKMIFLVYWSIYSAIGILLSFIIYFFIKNKNRFEIE